MYFKYQDTDRLDVNAWRGIYCINRRHKKALTLGISDKTDFKMKDFN